ncbi:MAG: hypothetical protein QM214_04870 [Bacillota bacterium]|jgi:hypothetical protein|nr:hypothetical protein [Bacillota bacterium]
MEKVRKGYEILDEKISPDNVMRMGELLALSALKFMCGHKMLHRMYVDYSQANGHTFVNYC